MTNISTGVAACHGWACKVSGPAGQSPAGRMMPADMTLQDLQELIGTVQQIGNMMGMVEEKIEMFLGPARFHNGLPPHLWIAQNRAADTD